MKQLLQCLLALSAAVLLVALGYPRLRAQRLTGLELESNGFLSTYLVFSKSEPGRCYVVNRRDATMRRSDNTQPGKKWDCHRLASSTGTDSDTWVLQEKEIGTGTVFLIPSLDVSDWTYPFLYQFVRENRPQLELSEVVWTPLYIDRIYHGLYLRVALPFDKRRRDGGTGTLREILEVQGQELAVLNTRMEPARELYVTAMALGNFPTVEPQPAALVWLANRAPTSTVTFLMSNVSPFRLSLLPLPVSIAAIYERKTQQPAFSFSDSRYPGWTNQLSKADDTAEPPFDDRERALLDDEFLSYSQRLRGALRSQAALNLTRDRIVEALHDRQAAGKDLGLVLGQL